MRRNETVAGAPELGYSGFRGFIMRVQDRAIAQRLPMTHFWAVFVLAASGLDARAMSSQQIASFSQNEFRTLPRICLAQQFIDHDLDASMVSEAERERWAAELGPTYDHYHHFCWGLLQMRRAAADPSQSDFNYRQAIGNFDYVLRRAEPAFALLPEIYLRKGLALQLLREQPRAASAFLNAIKAKRDYSPAYAALIELHLDLGDSEAAKQVLKTGLQYAPNSKILAKKKAEVENP